MAEKIFDAQSNYGWGLTLNMTGKAPAVSKRIFDTLADAQAFANDYNDSAIEGLLLSVVADGNNNGVYFVKSIKTGADAAAAVLEKLSTSNAAAGDLSGALAALDYADTVAVDEYVSAVSQEDGKISVNRAKFADAIVAKDAEGNNVKLSEKFTAIDTAIADAQAAAIASGTKIVKDAAASHITVTENKDAETGALTYTIGQSDIASAALLGTVNDEATANTAFGKAAAAQAEAELVAGDLLVVQQSLAETGTVGSKIKANADAIATLNGDATKAGSVSKAVADAKAELLGDAAADYNTLGKLEDKIQEVAGAAKSYEIVAVTEGLASNVKEAFKLVDEDGVQAGAQINVYKDSALKSITLEGTEGTKQELVYTYTLADGTEEVVRVDVSKFLAEAEFKNGLEVSSVDGTVSVKIDEASEDFLTVSESGVKLSGVQNAINAAEQAAKQHATDLDSALQARVKTIEDDYLVEADKTELSNAITAEATTARAAEQANADAIVTNRQEIEAIISENERVIAEALANIDSRTQDLEAKKNIIDSALQASDITVGSVNGTISVKGSNVAVKGLGSAAYTEAAAYATAAQGALAEAAAPQATTYTKEEVDAMFSWFEG